MIDQLADLSVIDQAEQLAALYQLFEAECTEVGHPLSERQRLAWHKCLARQSDGTKARLLGLFQVSELVADAGGVLIRRDPGLVGDRRPLSEPPQV